MVCGDPYQHPTNGRRIARPRGSRSGYIVDRCRTLVEARVVDGDSGRLQDGEGWTPSCSGQSVLVLCSIYYRPLASEELTPSAIEGACVKDAGVKAFEGFARLASFCRAISGPA